MITMPLSVIDRIVKGHHIGADPEISSISIDTRNLQKGDLYIAIKGENFDGNDFIEQAQKAGAAAAILERDTAVKMPRVLVSNTRAALAELAAAVRTQVALLLIGITGSNGKTTVKEMTAAILSVNASTLFTEGNLNNDIGVPLTLLRLHRQHQYAVVEMGANHAGEISYTARYAKPDIAILNNVGAAHIEGFGDLDGVAAAKAEIIESLGQDGIAILNADDPYFEFFKTIAGARRVISFGLSEHADVSAKAIKSEMQDRQFVTKFELVTGNAAIVIKLHLAGQHNVKNALAASAACFALGIEPAQIKQGLESMRPVSGRLQLLRGKLGNLIINDSYNANPASLQVALDVLQDCEGDCWVVLGAFGELGAESKKIHTEIGTLIKSRRVLRLLAIGSDAENSVRIFGKGATFFTSQKELIVALETQLTGAETLLIKGSRAQQMEKVIAALVAQEEK